MKQLGRVNSVGRNTQEQSDNVHEDARKSMWNSDNLEKVLVVLDSLNPKHFPNEEWRKPVRISEVEKKISDLNIRYIVQLSRLSVDFEKWGIQRRLVIQKIKTSIKRIQDLKSLSCTGRMVLSSADAIGTIASLVLRTLQNRWSSTLLYTAGSFGLMSFTCHFLELMKTRKIIEDVILEFRKDQEMAENIQAIFQEMDEFDECVQGLFPNGVDFRIMEFIQRPTSMEPAVRKEFERILRGLNFSKDNLQICLAVLLSNAMKNPMLLEDKKFLNTVKIFSKSSFAEKWWNRKKCQQLFPYSKSPKVLFQLNSFLKSDTATFQRLPLLITPALYINVFPAVISVLLNSLEAFSAFNELNADTLGKESETLRNLERLLSTEYERVTETFELINPHYE